MNFVTAHERARAAGATPAEIEGHARVYLNQDTANMIKALQLHPWLNTRDDWARLAGALKARRTARAKFPVQSSRH